MDSEDDDEKQLADAALVAQYPEKYSAECEESTFFHFLAHISIIQYAMDKSNI